VQEACNGDSERTCPTRAFQASRPAWTSRRRPKWGIRSPPTGREVSRTGPGATRHQLGKPGPQISDLAADPPAPRVYESDGPACGRRRRRVTSARNHRDRHDARAPPRVPTLRQREIQSGCWPPPRCGHPDPGKRRACRPPPESRHTCAGAARAASGEGTARTSARRSSGHAGPRRTRRGARDPARGSSDGRRCPGSRREAPA